MDIENLRYLLEVARASRLRDAAVRLKVDETTVSRRIRRLEKELGTRLFDRHPHGWRLTEPGRLLFPHAEAIELSMSRALEAVTSRSGELTGTARILAPDGFGAYVLVPHLQSLVDAHPHLDLEVLTATTHDIITARDFDVAITLERPTPRAASVRHLADYELRFYASPGYLERQGRPETVEQLRDSHELVWYIDAVLDVQPLRILEDLVPRAHARIQTNNISGHHAAARAGLGIVPLPTYIGADDPQLDEVLPEKLRARRSYWITTPRDLTSLARVREVVLAIDRIVRSHPRLSGPSAAADRR
ncbi:LysR family transcriptional regulator [Amycolatopsis rubida]|uniref:LysR family transcriptional regulator n=1 Tax=Amycolatopsis rubida TaxID=112413 RepID=A0ABX0CAG1_9PSEU|nr:MULTISPECIES: LysR family transcriptional regulator [Amycolatopsis]MYW97432.1 LysR family transcriptional regulator [Amycolatopsis rubida]NEC62417.1 LysR family transcriptional regulator [Amycolatopsis rubida]OAP21578.1 HTH-type transcriptional regulator GltR [Amycolatopsis sp. M39]